MSAIRRVPNRNRLAATTAALAAGIGASGPAHAYLPPGTLQPAMQGTIQGAVTSGEQTVQTAWDTVLELSEQLITQAIEQSAQQAAKSNQRLAESIASIKDGDNLAETQQELQRQQLQASRDFEPSFSLCQNASGARGMNAASEAVAYQRAVVTDGIMARGGNDLGSPAGSGATMDIIVRYNDWTEKYCNPARFGEICQEGAGAGPGIDDITGITDADIQTATLFETLSFAPRAQLNDDPSPKEAAAIELVMNLTQPFVENVIPPTMLTSNAGLRAFMRRRSEDSRLMMAQAALVDMVAHRTPPPTEDAGGNDIEPLGEWARQMLEEAGVPTDGIPDHISSHQIMEVLASRRFQGTGWYMKLQGMEPANVAREQAMMASMLLRMKWRNYQLMERLVGIRATRFAMKAEAAREPIDETLIPAAGATP